MHVYTFVTYDYASFKKKDYDIFIFLLNFATMYMLSCRPFLYVRIYVRLYVRSSLLLFFAATASFGI